MKELASIGVMAFEAVSSGWILGFWTGSSLMVAASAEAATIKIGMFPYLTFRRWRELKGAPPSGRSIAHIVLAARSFCSCREWQSVRSRKRGVHAPCQIRRCPLVHTMAPEGVEALFLRKSGRLMDHPEMSGKGVRVDEKAFAIHVQTAANLAIPFNGIPYQKSLQSDWAGRLGWIPMI